MEEGTQKQILLLAPDLLGQSLSLQLTSENTDINVCLQEQQLPRHPSLVIWAIESIESYNLTINELKVLRLKWQPCPVLLILPSKLKLTPIEVLEFECEGILQDPEYNTLQDTIATILKGGKVVKLRDEISSTSNLFKPLNPIAESVLTTCFNEINIEHQRLNLSYPYISKNFLLKIVLDGRRRELKAAKAFLIWFWGPLNETQQRKLYFNDFQTKKSDVEYATNIIISNDTLTSLLDSVFSSIEDTFNDRPVNDTGTIFAFEAIKESKKIELFKDQLFQLKSVLKKLQKNIVTNNNSLIQQWHGCQLQMKQESIRSIIGSYTRFLFNGESTPVAETVLSIVNLEDIDEELPSPKLILDALVLNKPIQVEGRLLSNSDPRTLLYLKLLIINFLIRNSELISSELLNLCSNWPELRHHLLDDRLISTRELERLRNRLNSQNRYISLIKRPIQLYESKRTLFNIKEGSLKTVILTELRDDELRNLDWIQRQVTLLVEARDALAPQIQSLIRYIGDFMVILLTNILGRALGLIGKGIAQGMGRSFSRK